LCDGVVSEDLWRWHGLVAGLRHAKRWMIRLDLVEALPSFYSLMDVGSRFG
jgi:hypothetical protein